MEFQGIDVGMGIFTYLYELIIINICQIIVKISSCKITVLQYKKNEKHSHSYHNQPETAGESGVKTLMK